MVARSHLAEHSPTTSQGFGVMEDWSYLAEHFTHFSHQVLEFLGVWWIGLTLLSMFPTMLLLPRVASLSPVPAELLKSASSCLAGSPVPISAGFIGTPSRKGAGLCTGHKIK
jgi:hypothetical protein